VGSISSIWASIEESEGNGSKAGHKSLFLNSFDGLQLKKRMDITNNANL
jgi:hypothetical protein